MGENFRSNRTEVQGDFSEENRNLQDKVYFGLNDRKTLYTANSFESMSEQSGIPREELIGSESDQVLLIGVPWQGKNIPEVNNKRFTLLDMNFGEEATFARDSNDLDINIKDAESPSIGSALVSNLNDDIQKSEYLGEAEKLISSEITDLVASLKKRMGEIAIRQSADKKNFVGEIFRGEFSELDEVATALLEKSKRLQEISKPRLDTIPDLNKIIDEEFKDVQYTSRSRPVDEEDLVAQQRAEDLAKLDYDTRHERRAEAIKRRDAGRARRLEAQKEHREKLEPQNFEEKNNPNGASQKALKALDELDALKNVQQIISKSNKIAKAAKQGMEDVKDYQTNVIPEVERRMRQEANHDNESERSRQEQEELITRNVISEIRTVKDREFAPQANTIKAMFPYLPLKDECFDKVICSNSISTHQISEMKQLDFESWAKEFQRVLKHGGKAYIFPMEQGFPYGRRYDRVALENALKEYGLEFEYVKHYLEKNDGDEYFKETLVLKKP